MGRVPSVFECRAEPGFKSRFGGSGIEAPLLEPLQLLRNGKAANFTLDVVGERFENDLLVETSPLLLDFALVSQL